MANAQLAMFAAPRAERVRRGATLSPHGVYRYRLWRAWRAGTRCVFVMLNPSTADERVDDPTIRRCVAFARAWGHGSLVVVNLFAYRATDPHDLRAALDPVGPRNNATIIAECARGALVVAAWGVPPVAPQRGGDVATLITEVVGRPLHCLGRTRDGHPRHPLYLRADARPQIFREVHHV